MWRVRALPRLARCRKAGPVRLAKGVGVGFECPGCKGSVVDLPGWWKSLPHESPAWRENGPPAEYKTRYLVAAGLVAGSVAAFILGNTLLGFLLLITGASTGAWMWQRSAEGTAKLEAWQRSKRCLACPRTFVP